MNWAEVCCMGPSSPWRQKNLWSECVSVRRSAVLTGFGPIGTWVFPNDHSSVPVKLPVITAVSHRGFSSFQAEQTKDAHYVWGANLENCTMSWDTKKLIGTGIKKRLQMRPIQPWVSRSKERRLMGAGVKHVRPFGLNLTGRYVSS